MSQHLLYTLLPFISYFYHYNSYYHLSLVTYYWLWLHKIDLLQQQSLEKVFRIFHLCIFHLYTQVQCTTMYVCVLFQKDKDELDPGRLRPIALLR